MLSAQPLNLGDQPGVQRRTDFTVEQPDDFVILYNNASGVRAAASRQIRADWDLQCLTSRTRNR